MILCQHISQKKHKKSRLLKYHLRLNSLSHKSSREAIVRRSTQNMFTSLCGYLYWLCDLLFKVDKNLSRFCTRKEGPPSCLAKAKGRLYIEFVLSRFATFLATHLFGGGIFFVVHKKVQGRIGRFQATLSLITS